MRTPEEIIGRDALLQLIFEGYEVVPASNQQPQLFGAPSDFDGFWQVWPNKVGKPAAQRAYNAARKDGVPRDVILAGVDRYIQTKPIDRPWLNPATFINQRRWNDQPAPVQQRLTGIDAVKQQLRQEILNAGYGGEKSDDREDVREFPRIPFSGDQRRY